MSTHKIGHEDEFPINEGTKADVDGIEIAVINMNGDLYGIQNRCPHKNLPLHIVGKGRFFSKELIEEGLYDPNDPRKEPNQDIRGGINIDELTINCPWHSLEWDLQTGKNDTMGVCIATYDINVDDDGAVWVEV